MGTEHDNLGDEPRSLDVPELPDPRGDQPASTPPSGDPPPPLGILPTYVISYQPTATPPEGNSESQTLQRPENIPMRVSLSSLAATEAALLLTTQDLVGRYERLRTEVAAVQGTVFGQTLTHEEDEMIGTGQATTWQHVVLDDPLHDSAVAFANEITPYMAQALRDFGQTMQIFGAHIQAYEATGDGYATADDHSRFDSG